MKTIVLHKLPEEVGMDVNIESIDCYCPDMYTYTDNKDTMCVAMMIRGQVMYVTENMVEIRKKIAAVNG